MPDIIDIIKRWWKEMLLIVVLAFLVVGLIVFLKADKYVSTATALPASSFANDKAKIFNENIQALYSELGTPDDLDIVTGLAALDTVYLSVVDQLHLTAYFKMGETGEAARNKAAYLLKKNTKVYKSEFSNLKVKVWDNDKNVAADMANAIMSKLTTMYQDIQSVGNQSILNGLMAQKDGNNIDTIYDSKIISHNNNATTIDYNKLITEYQFLINNKPPSLIIVEKAKPSEWPDRPKKGQLIVATGFLSLLFAFLLALVLDKNKTSKRAA